MIGEAEARLRECFLRGSGPAATVLEAMFEREARVDAGDVEPLLPRALVEDLVAVGLLERSERGYAPLARVATFRGALIASDRLGFRRHRNFVLGPGPTSSLLAEAVSPAVRGSALDLGCGPGTLTLWAAQQGLDAVGLDVNPRALAFAAFNRRLNAGERAGFRYGDYFRAWPAELEERFDVVLANPPFVLAPSSELIYRDRPLPGDDAGRVTVEHVARALAPGGRGYVVCNWIDVARQPWQARPAAWLRSTGCRGVVARVASHSAATYAARFSRDLPERERAEAVSAWTSALLEEGVERIHVGVIAVARPRKSSWVVRPASAIELMKAPGWRAIESALAT